jgi:phosphate transport system permease protein
VGDFGIWALILGTLLITIIALIVAIPIGLASAIYLSEYASRRVRGFLKPALEVLVGIPTVVFGFFAVYFMTPLLRSIFGTSQVAFFNVMSAGIVVGLLIVPLISSLAEDAMAAVPDSLRQAAYALGASRLEVALRVVVPAAISGIAAGIVIAMSRAVGETMVVTLAAGARPNLTLNPTEEGQTITAVIVQISQGEATRGSTQYGSIFAIGVVLFVVTLLINVIASAIVRRYRTVYE